ncbi:uncharacterized protein [Mytilus edulis]|uniref:uncharacterized protein isoform X1 n=1 Tax=Mytilus edulis TaxID=6550 RepID=UPI0039F0B135
MTKEDGDYDSSFRLTESGKLTYDSHVKSLCKVPIKTEPYSSDRNAWEQDEQNNNICKIVDVRGNVDFTNSLMNNNNNGGDKESLTGSSTTTENWQSNNVSRQSESINSTRNSMMLASSPAGVFKPPMTVADQRLISAGMPYSMIPSGGPVSPYSYFTQYGYPPRNYPQVDSYSYSAVLQSMGSHAAQTQMPCNTYGSQYSMLNSPHQRSMSVSASGQGQHVSSRRSPGDTSERDIDSNIPHNYGKEERTHSLSSVEISSSKTVSFKDPPPRRELINSKDMNYKVPSGKEGSLKHRILTRPSDSTPESSVVDVHYGEPSAKRTRYDPLNVSTSNHQEDNGSSANLHFPPHFMKGSIIQLTNGELKRVEDLQTADFVHSAEISNDLKIDSSSVVRIDENNERGTAVLGFVVGEHKVQVTVEASVEHPFFVFHQGWSSCDPQRTLQRYGLDCHKLSVGDRCISLTHKEVADRAAELLQQQQQLGDNPAYSFGETVSGNKSGISTQGLDLNRSQHR